MVLITSPDDLRVAGYHDLIAGSRRSGDRLAEVFVVEGSRAIRQVVERGWRVRSMMLLDNKVDALSDLVEAAAAPVYAARPAVFDRIAGFHVHRGVLALAERPSAMAPSAILRSDRPALVVEGVNDHENIGSLFRNAAAFGVAAVLLDPRCGDPLYRRSVRVSLGHVVAIPFARVEPWPDGLETLRHFGLPLVALSPRGDTSIDALAPRLAPGPVAVLVGSEADGLSPAALAAADHVARIPMAPGVDSLNVATAAAIALHRFYGAPSGPA